VSIFQIHIFIILGVINKNSGPRQEMPHTQIENVNHKKYHI